MEDRELYTLSVASQELINMVQTLQGALAMTEQLRGGMKSRGQAGEICKLADALIRGLPHQGYNAPTGFGVWRGRLENKVEFFSNPGEFSYCPKQYATGWGRCTRPGTTMFYGANNINTVWSELYPAVGDRIHLGLATKKRDSELIISEVGGMDYCRRFSRSMIAGDAGYKYFNQWLAAQTDEEQMRATLVDAYFADEFSATVTKPRDYLITATISGLLLDAKDDGGHFLLDGFSYPSVAHRGGVNFAIHPQSFDEKFEWQRFIVAEIVSSLGYGIYAYRELATAEPSKDGGQLKWQAAD